MTASVRSAILLAATLLAGVLLGVVGAGRLAQYRRDQVRTLRRPLGFTAHLERVIAPRDEAQRAAIRPLIEATGRRNEQIIREANERLRAGVDSLRTALVPLLDSDQRRRLDADFRPGSPFQGGAPGGRRPGRPPGSDPPSGAPNGPFGAPPPGAPPPR